MTDNGDRNGLGRGAERDHIDRPLRTLEQCALHRRIIRLTCRACGRVRRLDAIALWWLFQRRGWDDRIVGVARRHRCASCHEDRGTVVRPSLKITRERADDVQPPYPDASTWKKLVSRYRS